FQAEDGIRDFHVTGVQTCALPIFAVAEYKLVDIVGGHPLRRVLHHNPIAFDQVYRVADEAGTTGAAGEHPQIQPDDREPVLIPCAKVDGPGGDRRELIVACDVDAQGPLVPADHVNAPRPAGD